MNELIYLRKENNSFRKKIEEIENREKDLIAKMKALQSKLKEMEENHIKEREEYKQLQIPTNRKFICPQINTLNQNANLSNNNINMNERSLKKKCKSKEEISPSLQMTSDLRSCKI